MWRIALVLALLSGPAFAQTITVNSGEHDTFSRLVLALPTAQAWQLGRTDSGYELAIDGDGQRFDVSGVFDLIPKDRLTGIFADPASGRLQMTIGCQCHALPFSLDDRTIVIDLRDGPAPAGSSFELGIDGVARAALQGKTTTTVRPRARQIQPAIATPGFDWLTARVPDLPPASITLPPQPGDMAASIRESLVGQLADGASRNVIDLALPDGAAPVGQAPFLSDDVPIRVTGNIGVQIGDARVATETLKADGTACIPDDALNISAWASEDTGAAPYSGLHNGLVGEFDRPQNDAIIAAAQRQIYLGFGAEARSTLTAFGDTAGEDAALLLDLAALIDGDQPLGKTAFTGMAGCDTAAALWEVIADPAAVTGALNAAAVRRGFSALPSHLRTHLGPRLVENLLAAGRDDVAFDIGQAMGRGTLDDRRAVTLATSDLLLATGAAEEAVPALETVLADPGPLQAETLTKLVAAQVAAGQAVDPATADAILALIDEHTGHPLQADLREAYGLALAGSGQFAEAWGFADAETPLGPAFWSRLAAQGTDDDLLLFAITPPANAIPAAAVQTIADRLDALGFPTEAQLWRAGLSTQSVAADTAQAGPDQSIATDELQPPVAQSDEATTPASVPDDAARAARWNQNWALVAQSDPGAWGQLAQGLAATSAPQADASLAAANAALTQSTAARALIATLIAETATPPALP